MLDEDGPLDEPQDIEDVLRLYSLAELRLAQSRPREALDAALAVGDIGERTVGFLGYCPWRGTAAQASLVLGDRDRALELAHESVARAERTDVLHLRIRARRVLGLCEQGATGLRSLRAAIRLGGNAPPRIELAAAGARPRRDALLTGPGSLTPSERRIAELAATGQSNREIAQALFVTPKTVEYHLRNAYRKLDIQTRRELSGVLSV